MDSPDYDDLDPALFPPETFEDDVDPAALLEETRRLVAVVLDSAPGVTAMMPLDEELQHALATAPLHGDRAEPATGLMQILPADFPLPRLIKFVPNLEVKARLDAAVAHLGGVVVSGLDGLAAADIAMEAVRQSIKAAELEFADAAADAHNIHKAITGARADWVAAGTAVLARKGADVAREKRRLDDLERDQARQAQEQANRVERERLAAEAERQASLGAPAAVVEVMKTQAAVAQAPPPLRPVSSAAAVMTHSTGVKEWKARLQGTLADDEQQPEMFDLTAAQIVSVRAAMLASATTGENLGFFDINWPAVKARAKADGKTFKVAGFEAYEDYSTRAKGQRGAKKP